MHVLVTGSLFSDLFVVATVYRPWDIYLYHVGLRFHISIK